MPEVSVRARGPNAVRDLIREIVMKQDWAIILAKVACVNAVCEHFTFPPPPEDESFHQEIMTPSLSASTCIVSSRRGAGRK